MSLHPDTDALLRMRGLARHVPDDWRLFECIDFLVQRAIKGPGIPEAYKGENHLLRDVFADLARAYHQKWED